MRMIILAAALGAGYYAHTQGYDLWTADGWTKLFGSTSAQPPAANPGSAPNAGTTAPTPSPVLAPQYDCGCGGSCGKGCGGSAGTGAPISTKGGSAYPL